MHATPTLTPHLNAIRSALKNTLLENDYALIEQIEEAYDEWRKELDSIQDSGLNAVEPMVRALNKDRVEIDLIMTRGSETLRRQKGQLKIENTIMEEFLISLFVKAVPKLAELPLTIGP